jgi:hypothetical protein
MSMFLAHLVTCDGLSDDYELVYGRLVPKAGYFGRPARDSGGD